VAGVIFQTPTPLLMQNFWIRIRFLVWIFKFENQTHVQTPDTIDPTEVYQCFCLRNDNADSCCCLNWKVTQVLVSGPESNKTQHIFKPWMGSEIRFKIYWSSFSFWCKIFWIRIRFLVWIFKFENQTHVQTPATIDPTEIYQCFCLRNDNADSCCCLNWKVAQVLVSGPESNKTQHIFKPWMGSEIRFKI